MKGSTRGILTLHVLQEGQENQVDFEDQGG